MVQEDYEPQRDCSNNKEQIKGNASRKICLDCQNIFYSNKKHCPKCDSSNVRDYVAMKMDKESYTTDVPMPSSELTDLQKEGWEGYVAAGCEQSVEHTHVDKSKKPKKERDSHSR